ncbi:hypothetical protein KAU18_09040 [Candidatus Bathyarchaeota archaeon]|nr:hypothetical protein [Candidatus Bathyarchaeota archaeon]
MTRKYNTVDGIKVKNANEAIRQEMRRAKTIEKKMEIAAKRGVLDEAHYKKVVKILKYMAKDIW